jgi:diguanylate cyclase (GGDEF)-like protein
MSTAVLVSALSAAAFLAAAVAFAVLASSTRSVGPVDLLLVAAFAVLVRLEYRVGKGSAVPLQLAFVPMLFLMPLRLVPLAACAGSLLGGGITLAPGKRVTVCPNALGGAWFALPPAMLLYFAGERPFTWHDWPLYVAVFAVQSLADLVQTILFVRLVEAATVGVLLAVLATVYSFDALLTPVALLASREDAPYAFLALLPIVVVLHMLGRERSSRLDAQNEADRLHALAYLDDLTLATNRRGFDEQLTLAAQPGRRLSVCLLDLDHLKRFNDTFGHPAGDDLLRRIADAWLGALRSDAVLARIGGDEFGLILPGASPADAERVVERLRSVTPGDSTFSTGVASWNGEETVAELIARADAALYRAKSEGRDRLVPAA